jgi:hypothetical protein
MVTCPLDLEPMVGVVAVAAVAVAAATVRAGARCRAETHPANLTEQRILPRLFPPRVILRGSPFQCSLVRTSTDAQCLVDPPE